jgi:hypothetical protein
VCLDLFAGASDFWQAIYKRGDEETAEREKEKLF